MEHTTIDATIELEALCIAAENGIIWSFHSARLVVTMVNHQTTFHPLQSTVDRHHAVAVVCIKPHRINLDHVNHELIVFKSTVFGEKLKHSCKDAAREIEVMMFFQRDAAHIRYNDHTFSVT